MTRFETLCGAAASAALLLLACGPDRPDPNANGSKDSGTQNPGTQTDGGQTTDSGTDLPDAGTTKVVTVGQLRTQTYFQRVRVENVVVHTVEDSFIGKAAPNGMPARCTNKVGAEFWVVDPQNPKDGIQVVKDCEDFPLDYMPAVGDVLNIEGYFQLRARFDDRIGRRPVLRNEFAKKCNGMPCPGKLELTKVGTAPVPAPNVFSANVTLADGGFNASLHKELAGTRVFIPGPVELTNARPLALKRMVQTNEEMYFGFEVGGGILVNNYKTYGVTRDGGSERCDFRAAAADGGRVSFPQGLSGVWDTYTHAVCADGGVADNCFRNEGTVPGTSFGYAFVLYPQDCADLDGGVITP